MTYLIAQIALLLGGAVLIGILLGWWFKASRTPAVAGHAARDTKPPGVLPAVPAHQAIEVPPLPAAALESIPETARERQELSEALLALDTVQNALRQESALRAEAESRLENVLRRVEEAEDAVAAAIAEKAALESKVTELQDEAKKDRAPTRVTTTTALLSAERYKLRKAREELENATAANEQAKATIAQLRQQLGIPTTREKRSTVLMHGLVMPVPGTHPDSEPDESDPSAPGDLAGRVVAAAAAVTSGAPPSRASTRPGPRPQPHILLNAPDGPADDVKLITGIGPKLERLLNELGVYHYRQLSSLSDNDLAWLDDKIPGFQTRYDNRDWRGQAARLDESAERTPTS